MFFAAQSAQTFIGNFIIFINGTLICLSYLGLFLFFIVNAFRFFILGSNNQEGQEKAKALFTLYMLLLLFYNSFLGNNKLSFNHFDLGRL